MDKYLKLLGASRPEFSVVPCSPNDLIQVEAVSSVVPVTLEIEGIALDLNGSLVPFHFDMPISTANTLTTLRPRLGYQALLSLSIITRTSAIPDGACYVRSSVVQSQTRGVFPYRKLLTQGYVSTLSSIGYGSASIDGAPTNHNYLHNIEVADPAVGQPAQYLVPDYTRLQIIAAKFISALAIGSPTQFALIKIILPAATDIVFPGSTNHNGGTTIEEVFFNSPLAASATFTANRNASIPSLILEPGTQIDFSVSDIQAADQISSISLLVLHQTIPWA